MNLLQISLVYVNTMMIQRVLSEPSWCEKMTTADLRALGTLLCECISATGSLLPLARELASGSRTDLTSVIAELEHPALDRDQVVGAPQSTVG